MKIIDQYWEWEQTPILSVARIIESAGRTCYKSEDAITDDSAIKFCRNIIKRGHFSVIEHAYASIRLITNRGCCYDADTEVLTLSGWKYFKNISENDKFACLDNNGYLQWHQASNIIEEKYNGELLHFCNTSIDLMVTPNHYMWVFDYDKRSNNSGIWKFISADQLKNERYKFNKTCKWNGKEQNFIIPSHHKEYKAFPEIKLDKQQNLALLELMGLWITDGSYRYGQNTNGGSCLIISQSKQNVCERINKLCDIIGLRVSWYNNEARIDNLRLVTFFEKLFGGGAKTFTAYVPDCIKNASTHQISAFLKGVVAGDGNIHKNNGHIVIYSSSHQFVNDLQELYLKVGLSANIRNIKARKRGYIGKQLVKNTKDSFVLSVHGIKRSIHLLNRKCAKSFGDKVPYNGIVYCVTVPFHRLYVRRNGKAVWCGNSHELVRHRLASYSQESTRYCNYSKDKFGNELTFIQPVWWQDDASAAEKMFVYSMHRAEKDYLFLLKSGWSPQQAREILPNALKTEIVMTANLREWRHVFSLRCSPAAHPQIRALFLDILKEFHKAFFPIFEDLYAQFIKE